MEHSLLYSCMRNLQVRYRRHEFCSLSRITDFYPAGFHNMLVYVITGVQCRLPVMCRT